MPPSPYPKILVFILMLAALFGGCRSFLERSQNGSETKREPTSRQDPDLDIYGNISNAADDPDNFLILGAGSTLSYNNSRGRVNWVTWKTTRSDLGDTVERPDFRPDPRLPSGFERVVSTDYSGSGYDRGHLVPAADRFGDPARLGETFLMTNIVPQTRDLNQYPWEKLESYVRGQVRRGWDAYQIAGAYGEQGFLKNRIAVPTNCWKVVIFLRPGEDNTPLNNRTRIIAADLPNSDGIRNQNWQRYTTNIRSIETKTGYNFFAALPADLQEILETRTELSFRKTR